MKSNKIIEIYKNLIHKHHYCNAYHQAGQVAGIYFNSKAHNLQPGLFYITKLPKNDCTLPLKGDLNLRVEGGRLFQTLAKPNIGPFHNHKKPTANWDVSVNARMLAIETDIVNLLIGPIAEAKYIAECDNEIFNSNLVNFNALHHYGGSRDLAQVNEYLECLTPFVNDLDKKQAELFVRAFDFINDHSNWLAINRLAQWITEQSKGIIECAEIISVLEEFESGYSNRYMSSGDDKQYQNQRC